MAHIMSEDLVKNVGEWLDSHDGKQQLAEANEEFRQMSTALEKARELTLESLHEPVTL